jgi:hypothetical protein
MKTKKQITFWVTPEERNIIEGEAKSCSLPLASYCRSEILRKIKRSLEVNSQIA